MRPAPCWPPSFLPRIRHLVDQATVHSWNWTVYANRRLSPQLLERGVPPATYQPGLDELGRQLGLDRKRRASDLPGVLVVEDDLALEWEARPSLIKSSGRRGVAPNTCWHGLYPPQVVLGPRGTMRSRVDQRHELPSRPVGVMDVQEVNAYNLVKLQARTDLGWFCDFGPLALIANLALDGFGCFISTARLAPARRRVKSGCPRFW